MNRIWSENFYCELDQNFERLRKGFCKAPFQVKKDELMRTEEKIIELVGDDDDYPKVSTKLSDNERLKLFFNRTKLKLRIYDATMWHYHQLYLKEYAGHGISDWEFDELKSIFVDTMHQAEELMSQLSESFFDKASSAINDIIDMLSEYNIIYYSAKWKSLYAGLYQRIIENCIVSKDKRNLLEAYNVLSTLDTLSPIWYFKKEQMKEFLYYEFSDGHSCLSIENVVPKGLKFIKNKNLFVLVGEDVNKLRQEYLLNLILSVDARDVQKYREENIINQT